MRPSASALAGRSGAGDRGGAPSWQEPIIVESHSMPIELHCDLEVEPTKEKELVNTFHTVFEPTIGKQPGFVSVTLLTLRAAKAGYRLTIGFQSEEQRFAWAATGDRQRRWPRLEPKLE